MTDGQIYIARKQLPSRTNIPRSEWSEKEKKIDRELSCRDMINSILCYDGKKDVIKNRYLYDYIKELGVDVVQRLIDEQIEDFDKATVLRGVHTDSEGISYNSIIWAD
jgi:hypothetical protein